MCLNDIKLGNKVAIYNNDKEYITFVECIIDNNKILFQNIFEYNKEVYLDIGNTYHFVFFTESGNFQFICKILSYLTEGRRTFYLAEVGKQIFTDLPQPQKRQNTRYYCNLPYFINAIDNDKTEKISCIIKDIGFGGFRFITNHILKKDTKIELKLNFEDDCFFAQGEIIQYQNYPKSNYKNQYRIKFYYSDFINSDFFKKYFNDIKD